MILSQTMKFKKLKSDYLNVPKQAEAKRDGVTNPQNYNFNQFQHGKFDALNSTNQPKSTIELGYMCHYIIFPEIYENMSKSLVFSFWMPKCVCAS